MSCGVLSADENASDPAPACRAAFDPRPGVRGDAAGRLSLSICTGWRRTARHGRERCVRARGGRVEDGETANREERTGRPTSSTREGGRARWTSDHRGTTVCDGCCLLARLRTNRYQPSPFPPLARSPLHHLPHSPKRKRPWSLAAAARPRTAGSSRPCPTPHAPILDRHAPPGTSTEPTTNR